MNATQRAVALAAIAAGALAAGCGGGGGSSSPASAPFVPVATNAPVTPGGVATMATLSLALDGSVAQALRRGRSVSPATRGLGVIVTPAGGNALPANYFSLVGGNCTAPASDGSRVCSFALPVPVGASTAAITTYSAAPFDQFTPPTIGAILGTATVPITATAGATTTVPITLNNVVSRVQIGFANRPQVGASGTATVLVTAFDGANRAIVGGDSYANPITLTNSDTTGVTTLSQTAVTAPSTAVTIAYNGSVPTGPAFITASFAPVPGFTPTPVASPTNSSTPPPAAFVPLGPRPAFDGRTFTTNVLQGSSATTVVSPLPTISAYPNASFQPAPVNTASTGQVTIFYGPAPSASPLINNTPIATIGLAQEQQNNTLPGTNSNVSTTNYYNYVVSGNRINLVRTGQTQNTFQGFPAGTKSQNISTIWPSGQILAKSPLTAGDTWTNSLARTTTITNFDNRPGATFNNTNATLKFNADGSYTYSAQNFVGQSLGGGVLTSNWTIRPDGSWTEVDSYPPSLTVFANGGYTETDDVPAGPTASSIVTATLVPQNSSLTTQVYKLPYAAWFTVPLGSETFTVSGPGALDPGCGVNSTAAAGAYLVTATSVRTDPQAATTVTTTNRDYTIPGAGPVCAFSTTRTESHYVLTQVSSNGASVSFEAFATLAPVSVRTDTTARLQVQPYALSPQSTARVTSSVSSGPVALDGDAAFFAAAQERLERRVLARSLSAAFGGVR